MMKNLLQTFAVLFILAGVSFATWYAGGVVLVIIFAVIGLVSVILIAFALGSRWTFKTMKAGADLAIASSNYNDRNDAIKTQALAALVREAVKQFKTELPSPTMQLPSGFPPVQPLLGPIRYPEGGHRESSSPRAEHFDKLSAGSRKEASATFGSTPADDSLTFIINGLDDEDNVVEDSGHHHRDE